MELRKVREGSVEIYVPKADIPEHGRASGFYNPEMETDRDISVACLSAFGKKFLLDCEREPEICDLLCATGVRGIRYAKETGSNVLINDVNENAIELAGKNSAMNGVDVEISNKNANLLLAERRFDVIDIDPFGSPCAFMDSAARSLRDSSFLCFTATDTAALFGVYPNVCERRYGLRSLRCDFSRELGARILISFAIRELAKYRMAFTPVLSYARRHYVRIFGKVERSAEKSTEAVEKLDFISAGANEWKKGCCGKMQCMGKLYAGNIKDGDFCRSVLDEIRKRKLNGAAIVSTLLSEPDALFYYEHDKLSAECGVSMKIDEIIFKLARSGFDAGRTLFSDTGIKTTANRDEIKKILSAK